MYIKNDECGEERRMKGHISATLSCLLSLQKLPPRRRGKATAFATVETGRKRIKSDVVLELKS